MRSDLDQDDKDSTDDEDEGAFDNCIASHPDSNPVIGDEFGGGDYFGGGGSSGFGGFGSGGGFAVALLRKFVEQLAPLENVNWKNWFHDIDEYYHCYGDETLFEEEGGGIGARLFPSDYKLYSDNPTTDSSSCYDDTEYLSTETEQEKSRRRYLERVMFSSPREIAESSSRKRSSRSKADRPRRAVQPKDETPEEKEARREERRLKKIDRDARKAAEAEALLGIPRMKRKGKGKETLDSDSESKREKKSKAYVDEVMSGLQLRKPTMTLRRTGSLKQREVRTKHLTHSLRSRDTSLNNIQDSSTSSRKHGSEYHRHHCHEHSSAESALSCGRCIRRRRRREERAAKEAGRAEKAAMLERPERAPTPERDLRRRSQQEGEFERSRVEGMHYPEKPQPERRSRSKAITSRGVSPARPSPRRRTSERQVEIIRARQVERIPAEPHVEIIPARRLVERTPRQVEIIPARPTEQGSTKRMMNRDSTFREPTVQRPPERPRRRPTERAPISQEPPPILRRGSLRAPTSQGGIAPPPPAPATEKRRPILGFELEDKPEKLIECVTCLDDEIPAKDAAKLACGHWFCNECLKRLFTLSLTDPAHMPPKCCASDHIPLKHVDKLLSYQNKKLWNKKYLEYTTANRIYCPTTDCGEWIQPKDIKNGIGRCQECKNEVCSTCNGRAHGDGVCPEDPDMVTFLETAEKHKYQKCYNCKAMVELERGCNHMTCHCTAQFCYVCGNKWKTCDCPWFNYEPGEAEREYVVPDWNARVPVPPRAADRPQRGRHREQLREDEEVARRLAREMGAGGDPAGDLAREYYELPPALQIDPLAALGTLGLGLRNGIRRLATDYVAGQPERHAQFERQRAGAGTQADANNDRGRVRQDARGLLNTGPGLGLGLARVNGGGRGAATFYGAAGARPAPAEPAAVTVQAQPAAPAPVPHRQLVHVPALQRVLPRSNFLTESQQAHVERYLSELDLENAEPGVEAPFQQQPTADDPEPAAPVAATPHQTLGRSNTERTPRRTEHEVHRTRASGSGSGVASRESDVTGRAGLGLAGIGLRALDMAGVQQLVVGGGVGDVRRR